MAFDQKVSITNERIDNTNSRLDEFKQDLLKYEKQFQLLREDQSNVRDELIKYKEKVLEKINEINDNFLQESTKLRLLCSANSEYSKKNKHDIQELASRIKDLEYLTNEHTHKIYDINDLARRNMNEKLDIQKFNIIRDEIDAKIEYNKKSIKDLSNTLKETDNYVQKYLPFKVSNLIGEILKPITDEKGPFAGLIPNETALNNKILYQILNDDGEPTLDKEGNEIKKSNKRIDRPESPSITSPGKVSEQSKTEHYETPRDEVLKLTLQKAPSESISDRLNTESISKPINDAPLNKNDSSPILVRQPQRSATTKIINFNQTDDDVRFFSQSEKMLKIKYYIDRQMMAVNETVLEHQLEIVNKKMQKYEDELYKKIEDKVKILMFEFDHAKSEISTYCNNLHNELESEVGKRRKFLEEITLGFKELNQNLDKFKEEMASVFHILTGMADTFVLVLENISLSKVIDDEREEFRKQLCKCLSTINDKVEPEKLLSRNQNKIGARLVRTSSTNYRIHSKKVPNKLKERKMFVENSTPLRPNKDMTELNESLTDVMQTSFISSTVIFKGDVYEVSSLNSFKNKIIETLEKTSFPWRNLVKKSIKAIEAFRKSQPKSYYKSAQPAADIPVGPTETTALNLETESGGVMSSRKGTFGLDALQINEVITPSKKSTPIMTRTNLYVQQVRPSTDINIK